MLDVKLIYALSGVPRKLSWLLEVWQELLSNKNLYLYF